MVTEKTQTFTVAEFFQPIAGIDYSCEQPLNTKHLFTCSEYIIYSCG